MTEVIDRIPQLENKIYIIGGPRKQALTEAMSMILGLTDKHFLSTEFYCLRTQRTKLGQFSKNQPRQPGLEKERAPTSADKRMATSK